MSLFFKLLKIMPHFLKGNVITLILIILKLTGVIGWPWLWVITLVWLPFVLLVGVLLMLPILAIFGSMFSTSKSSTVNGVTKSFKRKNAFSAWQEFSEG